jgi:hypothetical protein
MQKGGFMVKVDAGRSQAKIRYTLQPVPPKARKNNGEETPYAAHVVAQPASLATLAQQMVREGSKYSESEIVAIATQLMETMAYRLANGEAINLGSMVRLRPAIRGTFATNQSPFNAEEHDIIVTASIGSRLRKIVQGAAVEQVDHVTLPKLKQIEVVQKSAEAPINLIVHGLYLTKQPCGMTSEWFVRVGETTQIITPSACNERYALFVVPREQLPAGATFTMGLRVYVTPDNVVEVCYNDALNA